VEVLDAPASMRRWTDARRAAGRSVGLVPTMGALHDGHLALVERAPALADDVVVSIFVNPLQFDVRADFDRYPRPVDDDLAACSAAGVDAVYAPTAAAMYPEGFDTRVVPGRLADVLEGVHRPGHFEGVTTVVTKLFTAVRPDLAVFGRKDAQQLALIRRLTTDLDLGVEIVAHPTVREDDGLALSSRNRRLTADDRAAATCLSAGLFAAARLHAAGERRPELLVAAARQPIDAEPRARPEYVELVDETTFEPVHDVAEAGLLVVAAWFGEIRLIDNLPLGPDGG
jgi:pantoate--beta-alanine ligase